MDTQGLVAPTGELTVVKIPKVPDRITLKDALPQSGLPAEANEWRVKNFPRVLKGRRKIALAKLLGVPHFFGSLYLQVFRSSGEVIPLGLAGNRVVTTAGVNFIVDAFQNTVEVENLKFHGLGTGGAAEAVGNTALTTELTTEYLTNSTRPTGSTIEGASANIYRTVGTITVDATVAATEHGIFDSATAGAGTLLDRTLFSVINLASGDAIQATYDLTFTAGS
jgi:hypothetical protein